MSESRGTTTHPPAGRWCRVVFVLSVFSPTPSGRGCMPRQVVAFLHATPRLNGVELRGVNTATVRNEPPLVELLACPTLAPFLDQREKQ